MGNEKKPDYWYEQSAVVPYLYKDNELHIVLITSMKRKRWIVPKGIVEPDMTPELSAAKEALEEAGIKGEPGSKPLGSYKQEKWNGICEITVYPMLVTEVLDEWLEKEQRKRRILPLQKAVKLVDDESLRKLLEVLPKKL